MTSATFTQALRAAVPDLVISDEADPGPTPAGHIPIAFHVVPVPEGVRLSIKIGTGEPHRFMLASEEEAADYVGRLWAAAT